MTAWRRPRRGNYGMMLVIAMVVLLGFGALAIDTGYMLLARAQAQDVADAASQAALVVLRQTGDADLARDAAERVVSANEVAGHPPRLVDLTFGAWDDMLPVPAFIPFAAHPNAVRVTVARDANDPIPYLLARIWGYTSFQAEGRSTSATRSIQVAIVLDITGSWGERDFAGARDAVLRAVDMLSLSASGVDELGMSIFTNRYAWEYTPFTRIAEPAHAAAVRANWAQLSIASKAGRDLSFTDGVACQLNTGGAANDFTSPAGGCYPAMPREYTDEPGTDHSTGVLLAQQMFEELVGSASYRAMIVLTDGRPNDLGASSGTIRESQGFVEDRWREFLGPVPRTKDQIRTASILATQQLWDRLRVHTWVVSLVEHDSMMPAMVHGDGYYTLTDDSGQLEALLAQIVSEMPLAIVE